MNDLISVIVPVYQAENTLEKCINSIIEQTYSNLQIILVDDGSTDRSPEICDMYALMDERIVTIHSTNGGPVKARKLGLEIAEGTYVGFVDSDDYLNCDMYRRCYEAILEHNADMVHSFWWKIENERIESEGDIFSDYYEIKNDRERSEAYDIFIFGQGRGTALTPSLWSKLFKKELIKEAFSLLPDDIFFGEDLLCLFLCIHFLDKLVVLDERLYYYSIRGQSLSHLEEDRVFFRGIQLMSRVIELNNSITTECNRYSLYKWIKRYIGNMLFKSNDLIDSYPFLFEYGLRNIERFRKLRVAIYGAGSVGKSYLFQLQRNGIKPIALIDRKFDKTIDGEIPKMSINDLDILDFDLIIIAIKNPRTAEEIMAELRNKGIIREKLYWEEPLICEDSI